MGEHDLPQRDDNPRPAGNRWGVEIDRIDVEIRSLRHRADTAEQIHILQGEVMKTFDKDMSSVKSDLWGANGSPGIKMDVDRLKQRALGTSEALQLRVTMAAALVGAVAGPLVAWLLSK